MTWGNLQRYSLGHIKRMWVVNREIIAAIYSTGLKKVIKSVDVFDFGVTPNIPTEKPDREYMKRRHEHRKKLKNGSV